MILRILFGISFIMGYAFFVVMLIIAALMIPFSREAAEGAAEGLRLFALSVLPSLFPFFVCANYLSGSGILQKAMRGKKAFVFVFSSVFTAICGTPSAALVCEKLVSYGYCEKREASLLCAALNQAGPVFIISTVSAGFLGRIGFAPLFALAHYLPSFAAVLILSVAFRFRHSDLCDPIKSVVMPPAALFAESVSQAVTNILRAGGTIVFFRVLHSIAAGFGLDRYLSAEVSGLLTGCFEMTNGVQLLCAHGSTEALSFCAFLISFGGVCIFLQTKMLFPGLDSAAYFSVKLAVGAASAILFYVLLRNFAPSIEVIGGVGNGSFSDDISSIKARVAALIAFSASSGLALTVSAILSHICRRT